MRAPEESWQRLAAVDEIPARGVPCTFRDGPCAGSRLRPLPVRVVGGEVWLAANELATPLSGA